MTRRTQSESNTTSPLASLVWLLTLIVLIGCAGEPPKPAAPPVPKDPLKAMKSAIRKGQWQDAQQYVDAVLIEHADDVDVLVMVAKVAHANDQPARAADLLADACRVEGYVHEGRVQQTMIAMISAGRLHDGIDFLVETIKQQPMQHETRRWLYDFYMGSENRAAGLPHGRFLVRHRKFDLELLQSLSNTERRSMDPKPLEEMAARNPNDKRPLLGNAKIEFDKRDYQAALKILRSINDAHPEYLPAQALMGKTLAAAGQFDELEKWVGQQADEIAALPGYWIALGDWAEAKQKFDQAARAYWEATRRDADVMEAWSKLGSALKQIVEPTADVAAATEHVDARATLLSKFNQLKNRFERTGGISREIVVQMAATLRDLGRLWEAEAWAAMALTLPEDDAVSVAETRAGIVALLRQDTPWQVTDEHPEFQIDLSQLAVPSINAIAVDHGQSGAPVSTGKVLAKLSLVNEAKQRGLNFFGRTSDDLDQPGIMLHETLGCGGGTIDFDLDGWSDLYLIAAGGKPPGRDSHPNALMRNLDGVFADATVPSQTGDTGFGQGVAVGDVNEDGFADLLVLNYGPNRLLINNGDGSFSDASGSLPGNAASVTWSTSGAIADLDGDAISDVVIVNYCVGLEPSTEICPIKDSDVFRSCSPIKFAGAPDQFLQGAGDGSLIDKTEAWGAAPAVVGRGLGIVAGSFDDQVGVDVFVANDMTNNHYWSRVPDSEKYELRESAMLRGLGADDRSLAQGSMGIATGDFDGDGDVDFYVTNFEKEYNTYHEQRGAGLWQDRTSLHKLALPTLPLVGFGTEAVDLDNDGVLELVVTNGHVDMFSRGDERSVYAHPMQIFRRDGQQQFQAVEQQMGGEYLSAPHVGRALWTLDANGDHKTDFVVTHQTEPVALLINQSENVGNWIEIQLVGRHCSRDAIGSIVEVRSGRRTWKLAVTSGDGYLCSNERTLRLGIGDESAPCAIEVIWPDGSRQEFLGIEPNSSLILIQDPASQAADDPL